MTIKTNTFEGVADTTVMTTTNSAEGGDAFNFVQSGEFLFTTDQKSHGSASIEYTADSITKDIRWTGADSANMAFRGYFRFGDVTPAANMRPFGFRSAGNVVVAAVVLKPDGTLRATNKYTEIGTASAAISADTWYRIEGLIEVGGAGSDRFKWAYYLGDSETAIKEEDNTGLTFEESGNGTQIWFGKGAATAMTGTSYVDAVAWDDAPAAGTFIGPASNAPAKIADLAITKVSSTSVSCAWTDVGDAPDGYSIVRCPGTQVNDDQARTPSNPDYDPRGLTNAATVVEGHSGSPYIDTGITAGTYTWWVVRTAP